MNSTIWLTLALILVLEGLGSMLYPRARRKMISAIASLPDSILRRFGGRLVVAGIVIYYTLRRTIGQIKNRLIEVTFECKECCNLKKAMVESTFKQTVTLKSG